MDPVADMLVIIKNGYLAKKESVMVPYSKFKWHIAKVLEKEKFVGDVQKNENAINIKLLYENNSMKIHDIKRVSKLGRRVYSKSKHIKLIKGGRGTTIISTPQGVMTSKEAKKKNLGGEIICEVW